MTRCVAHAQRMLRYSRIIVLRIDNFRRQPAAARQAGVDSCRTQYHMLRAAMSHAAAEPEPA